MARQTRRWRSLLGWIPGKRGVAGPRSFVGLRVRARLLGGRTGDVPEGAECVDDAIGGPRDVREAVTFEAKKAACPHAIG